MPVVAMFQTYVRDTVYKAMFAEFRGYPPPSPLNTPLVHGHNQTNVCDVVLSWIVSIRWTVTQSTTVSQTQTEDTLTQ